MQDKELQELIDMSGLQECFIASEVGMSAQYLNAIKSGTRKASRKRLKVKTWLINYIKHFLTFKFAA